MSDSRFVCGETSGVLKEVCKYFHVCLCMSSGVFRIWQRGGYGERVEREPITGVWGRSPQRGPGADPLVGGSEGKAPLKLKHFLLLNVQWKPQIRPFF